jgi:copper chaperone
MPVTREYIVSGMHCQHCASSVTREVSAVDGVSDAKVDLYSGQLIVISESEIPFPSIEAAVGEAGYRVAAA